LLTEVLGDKILKFNFKDINLADSLSDPAGSKGFVTYQIDPYLGLNEGTVIENSAGIYFDFNAPVITNTTKNTLVSTLSQINTITISETTCDSYTAADGQIYTASGTYTAVIPNLTDCDSTITIHLKVNQSTSTITETVCNSYTAPDGLVYTNSGTYSAIIPNAAGCDSTITINLTVNNPSTSTISETVCNSYTAADGQVFTNSGNYVVTIPNASACDSIISYQLIINKVDTSLSIIEPIIASNAFGAIYQWLDCENAMALIVGATNQYYSVTQEGVYAVQLTQNGCTDTSACTPMNLQGLNTMVGNAKISLYPNPTDGLFKLDLGQMYNEITIKIADLQGREVKRQQVSNQQYLELELKEATGVYLVHVLSENEVISVIRLVKE